MYCLTRIDPVARALEAAGVTGEQSRCGYGQVVGIQRMEERALLTAARRGEHGPVRAECQRIGERQVRDPCLYGANHTTVDRKQPSTNRSLGRYDSKDRPDSRPIPNPRA